MKDYGNFRRHVGAVPFEIAMVIGMIVTYSQGNWKHFAAAIFTFSVSFLPLLIERWFRVILSWPLQLVYVGFVFASFFAGEVMYMYSRIWEWDDTLHFISGLLVGLGGILWLTVLRGRTKRFAVPAWFEAVWLFGVTISTALLWELIEFGSDQLFGTFTQGADLFDTMIDLFYGTISALVMAILWAYEVSGRPVPLLHQILRHFRAQNAGTLYTK